MFTPVTPVDVVLKDRNSKHVHVVTRQHQLTVFSSLQIYALNFVRTCITPIQQAPLHIVQHYLYNTYHIVVFSLLEYFILFYF